LIALKFTVSLRKNQQFGCVFKGGRSKGGKLVVVFVLKNNQACLSRLGITVSKKMGKSAVSRNRQKRHIKEAYRALEDNIIAGYDIVVLPKAPLTSVNFFQIKDDLEKVLKKHDLFVDGGAK